MHRDYPLHPAGEIPAMDVAAPSDSRRASLGDAMILITSLAVGLTLSLRPIADLGEWFAQIQPPYRSDATAWWGSFVSKLGPQFLVIQGCLQLLSCFVAPLTPALIVTRLRFPRPPWRVLACQPGFVASAALCVATIVAVDLSMSGRVSIPLVVEAILPGATVLASWSALIATGRWRPEAGWIDRAGRAVGAFWLATIPWSIWVAS